jgi:preprotein translocase subunit SecE
MGFIDYLKETRTELKHVSWATRKQAVNLTLVVIGISILVALLLGAFDAFFDFALRTFVLENAPVSQVETASTTVPNTVASTTATSTNTN